MPNHTTIVPTLHSTGHLSDERSITQPDVETIRKKLAVLEQDLFDVDPTAVEHTALTLHTLLTTFDGLKTISFDRISISRLKGGYDALTFCLETFSKKYVLRIFASFQSRESRKREIFAMESAAAGGLAPVVYYVAKDDSAILMDFIESVTLSAEKAKAPEQSQKLARMIRRIHRLPQNPHPTISLVEAAKIEYHTLTDYKEHLGIALPLLHKLEEQLAQLEPIQRVDIHGDLNPRNIFLDVGYVIDWTYSKWEDPFFDLSYFALFYDYSDAEEGQFLEGYMDRELTYEEKKRYTLVKRTLLINFAFFFQSFVQDMNFVEVDPTKLLKPWTHYVQLFAGKDQEFTAQDFHEWSRLSIELANEKIISNMPNESRDNTI